MYMTGPKYIICDNPYKTVTDAVTGLEVRANPYNESLFVPDYVDPATSGFPTVGRCRLTLSNPCRKRLEPST